MHLNIKTSLLGVSESADPPGTVFQFYVSVPEERYSGTIYFLRKVDGDFAFKGNFPDDYELCKLIQIEVIRTIRGRP